MPKYSFILENAICNNLHIRLTKHLLSPYGIDRLTYSFSRKNVLFLRLAIIS